ncbi:tyrosine-type recombinase/integrase [Tsuneonella troitsensis]|uniref:tyrosine-type recombinase/integrase n=1 Tax=Tsuneonella troitsensis TaxID=292222 RepID=UPI00071100B4|nr:tyrosine-type recombinase/integrase [Tsuneonella troitsensis]
MASLKLHRQRWQTKVRIPSHLVAKYEGRKFLYRHLATSDRKEALQEANLWEAALRIEWAQMGNDGPPDPSRLRDIYSRVFGDAIGGAFLLQGDPGDPDEVTAGISRAIDQIADQFGDKELPEADSVRLAALNDALLQRQGRRVPRRVELEPTFRALADDYLTLWRTQQGLKETNTEQQKVATFDLFALYWGPRPIRDIRKSDAAAFVDALRQLNPLWGRSPAAKSKGLSWSQLQQQFGRQERGLSDATINRHMATLQSFWKWAQERDHCEGNNPFSGFHKKLKDGRNVRGYLAWETEELQRLFDPPPKRADLVEVMQVAMFTGMRLDEIASLEWEQVRKADGVPFIQVTDAKTVAGVRRVPLHPRLSWLLKRQDAKPTGRIWPGFNPEGPGKKAGADAGKEFSRFKLALGFDDRRKVFHSFRKNVVGQLEAASVPESEVAQLVGHEKGFTFGRYGAGVSLARLAEIVALIDYPDVPLPHP